MPIDETVANQTMAGIRQRLDLLAPVYKKAVARTTGAAWAEEREQMLSKIIAAVSGYDGKEATLAVFILGQVKQILGDLEGLERVKLEYESLEQSSSKIAAAVNEQRKEWKENDRPS